MAGRSDAGRGVGRRPTSTGGGGDGGGGSAADSYASLEPEETMKLLVAFLRAHCARQIEALLRQADETKAYGVVINWLDFLDNDVCLCNLVFKHAVTMLPLFDEAIRRLERETLRASAAFRASGFTVKENVHARLSNMPICAETTKNNLPRSADYGSFISMSGTVIRTGMLKLLESTREYECTACHHRFEVHADVEQHNAIAKPTRCPNTLARGAGGRECQSTSFELLPGGFCRDYQELKVQENMKALAVGKIPRSIVVILQDDLVDSCKAGDDVTVCGVVLRRWVPERPDERVQLEVVVMANHVRVNNEQAGVSLVTDELRLEFVQFWHRYRDAPMSGRNAIVRSICPQLFGLYIVKMATAVVLMGAVSHAEDAGIKVRGESHMLLVGDPGTGKSQILKAAARLAQRSVLTTGIGSTSAGLTVTAVKDAGGEWSLEAGALVIADGGVCCVDEFDSIRPHDRATIHEAMEQQTLSVAKAGLVCKLSTRTSVFAATNPKGKFDPALSVSVNTAIPSPLLSRFDLVFVLIDTQNNEWDSLVSKFILRAHVAPPDGDGGGASGASGTALSQYERERRERDELELAVGGATRASDDQFSNETLQAYISLARAMCAPALTHPAALVLQQYYRMQRQSDSRQQARTTLRLLESLVRLAQGHARLLFRQRVLIQDAVVAVTLMEASLHVSALLGVCSALHSAFPDSAEDEYELQRQLVLERLELSHLQDDPLDVIEARSALRALVPVDDGGRPVPGAPRWSSSGGGGGGGGGGGDGGGGGGGVQPRGGGSQSSGSAAGASPAVSRWAKYMPNVRAAPATERPVVSTDDAESDRPLAPPPIETPHTRPTVSDADSGRPVKDPARLVSVADIARALADDDDLDSAEQLADAPLAEHDDQVSQEHGARSELGGGFGGEHDIEVSICETPPEANRRRRVFR